MIVFDHWRRYLRAVVAFTRPEGQVGAAYHSPGSCAWPWPEDSIWAAVTERLTKLTPRGVVVVAESGVRSREEAVRLAACRVDALLVGGALVSAADAAAKLRELLGSEAEA